jgi:uncharacterized delta-60 repeat protein
LPADYEALKAQDRESIVMKTFKAIGTLMLFATLAGCGGGGDSGGGATPPPPPPPSGIGAAGGTVTGPAGAKVVVPSGALTTNVDIAVAQSSAGSPAMPAGVTAFGQMFAFTPHGTTFAAPVTITVPFDPATVPAGSTPVLYKTNANQSAWEVVTGATVSGSTMTAAVASFSFAIVASDSELTVKHWKLWTYDDNDQSSEIVQEATQFGGLLDKPLSVGGPLPFVDAGRTDKRALLHVFSNTGGSTFFTSTEAPAVTGDQTLTTAQTELTQRYTFQKTVAGATLKFVVTSAKVETIDAGGAEPGRGVCPWLPDNATEAQLAEQCGKDLMHAHDTFVLTARKIGDPDVLFIRGGELLLRGHHGFWNYGAYALLGEFPLWSIDDFTIDFHTDESHELRHTTLTLKAPITVNVPLDELAVGDKFNVEVYLRSLASNLVQGESIVNATLKDPLQASGVAIELSGLVQLPTVDDEPLVPTAHPCATAPLTEAGTIQFKSANSRFPERQMGADVSLERTGGTAGAVSVRLQTADGSAIAGGDYQSVDEIVRWGDGEGGERVVNIPFVLDAVEEPEEAVNLNLTTFSGCAALGAQAASTVTILDDDRPVPVAPTFTISGTVVGLEGSGLVLRTTTGDQVTPTTNGAFAFVRHFDDGSAYAVTVVTQPNNPAQVCSVTNGSGTISGADVTNVAVSCNTPGPNGSLDRSFGLQGKVFDTSRPPTRILQQADGKLLVIAAMTLSRYNTDGTLDATFGTAGRVTIVGDGDALDAAYALTVQPDGKIIVVGDTSSPTMFQIRCFVERFNADGTLDATFGTGGTVFEDSDDFMDDLKAVMLQPDGKILVAGSATPSPRGLPNSDFAVMRFLSNGTIDDQFGFHGFATQDLGGRTELVSAAALQEDGSIVVTGRVFTDPGSGNSDFGIVRFLSTGQLDTTFGGDGIVRYDFTVGGDVPATFDGGNWDVPADILIQPDQKIVIVGYTSLTPVFTPRAAVMRLTTFGLADPAFGTAGLATVTALTEANGVAMQEDGKLVIVGRASGDFGIERLTAAGTVDDAFGTDGLVKVDFFGGNDSPNAVLVQGDGRIVAAGLARNGSGSGLGIVRVMP